jgi:hypothetical protein
MPDCPASGPPGAGMNKNTDAGTSQVPKLEDPVWYRKLRFRTEIPDVLNTDAGAQLCFFGAGCRLLVWVVLAPDWVSLPVGLLLVFGCQESVVICWLLNICCGLLQFFSIVGSPLGMLCKA